MKELSGITIKIIHKYTVDMDRYGEHMIECPKCGKK